MTAIDATTHVLRTATIAKPDLSIIMAAYNVAPYVGEALASILSQPGVDVEIVIAEGPSTDGTLAEILALNDPRLTVLTLPEKSGAAGARNAAARLARAPWLCIFDADDVMRPNVLAPYLKAMREAATPVWGYCGLQLTNRQGVLMEQVMLTPFDVLKMIQRNIVPNPMALVRRDIFEQVGGYDPAFTVGEDYDLWLRMYEWSEPFFYNQICVNYRRHGENVSAAPGAHQQQTIAKLVERLTTAHAKPECDQRREVLRRGVALIHAAMARQWSEVLTHAAFLYEQNTTGLELDRHIVLALTATGRLDEAFRLTLMWVQNMAQGARLMPYETIWVVVQALDLACRRRDIAVIPQLLPLAKSIAAQVPDITLPHAIRTAEQLLAATAAETPNPAAG